MKIYLNKLAVLFLIVGVLQSCEDYLEEVNPNEISSDVYWSNLNESESNLTSVYGAMLNEYIYNTKEEAWFSDEGYAGERISSTGIPNARLTAINWYNHQINNNVNEVILRYDALYQLIWRANQVIEGLNVMSEDLKSSPRWTEQMGQARFFRGLGHFYLHSTYNNGNIIIRDKAPSNSAEFNKAVSDSETVMAFFREDLEYAYQNLPGQMEPKSKVDAGTAGTILGMSYLYEGEHGKAKTYFNDIINNINKDYGYQLVQDTSILFTQAGDYNSESIFEINFGIERRFDAPFDQDDYSTRNARYCAPRGGGGSSSTEAFTPSSWLIHAYSTDEMDPNDSRNTIVDRLGVTRLRNVPLRASAMIAVVNDEATEYYQKPSAAIVQNFKSLGLYGYFKKYTNHTITNSEANLGVNNWHSGKNIILNRLSGVYLMMAECLLETGDLDGALAHINTIRKRWGLLELAGTDYDTVEEVRDRLRFYEYPMELSVEGFATRTIDLRRWGVAKARFQALSEEDYYATDYDFVPEDPTANKSTCKNCLLRKGISTNTEDVTVIKEYVQAAISYKDGYLPLPSSEVNNNPSVN